MLYNVKKTAQSSSTRWFQMKFTVTSSRTFFFSDVLVLKLSFVNNSSTCEASLTLFTNSTASSQTFHFLFILTKIYVLTIVKLYPLFQIFPRISWKLFTEPKGSVNSVGLLLHVMSMSVQYEQKIQCGGKHSQINVVLLHHPAIMLLASKHIVVQIIEAQNNWAPCEDELINIPDMPHEVCC
jgi:hypothetical protein